MNAGAVRLKLRDPHVLELIARAAGAASVRATDSGTTSTIIRTVDVPEAARAFVRRATIDITETRVWNSTGASLDITVDGIQASMQGQLELQETGDHCVLIISGSVTASMSFASSMVESMLKQRLVEAMNAELEALSRA